MRMIMIRHLMDRLEKRVGMNRLDALIRNNRPSLLSRIVSWVFGSNKVEEQAKVEDEYKTVIVDGHCMFHGYKCTSCGVIREHKFEKCVCKSK